MRITGNMLMNSFMSNLQGNLNRMEKNQNQLATGRKFYRPSEDPVGVTRSLQARTDVSKVEQYMKNVNDGITWLSQSETALMEINELIVRAYELGVDAANGTKGPDDRNIIAMEIKQLQNQLVQAANSSYNGRYLFGGYNTSSTPFVEVGVSGDTILQYNGMNLNTLTDPANAAQYEAAHSQNIQFEVGRDVYMSVSFNGIDLFGGGEDNLYEIFNKLHAALVDGTDQEAIGELTGQMNRSQQHTMALVGEAGGKYNRLTLMEERYDKDHFNFKALQSQIEDVDYAKAVTDFKMTEIVYQSALSAAARIIQPTLLDFLR